MKWQQEKWYVWSAARHLIPPLLPDDLYHLLLVSTLGTEHLAAWCCTTWRLFTYQYSSIELLAAVACIYHHNQMCWHNCFCYYCSIVPVSWCWCVSFCPAHFISYNRSPPYFFLWIRNTAITSCASKFSYLENSNFDHLYICVFCSIVLGPTAAMRVVLVVDNSSRSHYRTPDSDCHVYIALIMALHAYIIL